MRVLRQFILIVFLSHSVFASLCSKTYEGLIGVTDVEITNKTARLVYNTSGIQSEAAVALKQTDCFNVLDWQRLKEVIERNKIEWTELQDSEQQRSRLKDILSVDYFLVVSIPSFSDDTEFSTDAFSKSKKQVVKVKVNLMIKDALTNELLTTVSSEGEASKKLTQSLGFGASGNPSGELPNKALEQALKNGIAKLVADGLPELSSKSKNYLQQKAYVY